MLWESLIILPNDRIPTINASMKAILNSLEHLVAARRPKPATEQPRWLIGCPYPFVPASCRKIFFLEKGPVIEQYHQMINLLRML